MQIIHITLISTWANIFEQCWNDLRWKTLAVLFPNEKLTTFHLRHLTHLINSISLSNIEASFNLFDMSIWPPKNKIYLNLTPPCDEHERSSKSGYQHTSDNWLRKRLKQILILKRVSWTSSHRKHHFRHYWDKRCQFRYQ